MRRHLPPRLLARRKSLPEQALRCGSRVRSKTARFFVMRRHPQLLSEIDVMDRTRKTPVRSEGSGAPGSLVLEGHEAPCPRLARPDRGGPFDSIHKNITTARANLP